MKYLRLDYDNIKIVVTDYPFKPPKIYINKLDYIQFLVKFR